MQMARSNKGSGVSQKLKSILHLAQYDAMQCCATGHPERFVGIRAYYRDSVQAIDAPDWIAAGSVERADFCQQVLVSVVERGAA